LAAVRKAERILKDTLGYPKSFAQLKPAQADKRRNFAGAGYTESIVESG